MTQYVPTIVQVCSGFVKFDPNYSYDDDNMDVSTDDAGWADDDNELAFEDDAGNVDDDASWKVRAATRRGLAKRVRQ